MTWEMPLYTHIGSCTSFFQTPARPGMSRQRTSRSWLHWYHEIGGSMELNEWAAIIAFALVVFIGFLVNDFLD